jgi:signal transduction histidine kinase
MKLKSRSILTCGVLCLIWLLFVVWQFGEHQRVVKTARKTLQNHVRDISMSLGVVIRSQSRFGAARRGRLERSLQALVKMSELQWVSLQSPNGQPVITVGPANGAENRNLPPGTAIWEESSLTIAELVQLGSSSDENDPEKQQVVLVESRSGSPPFRQPPQETDPDNPEPPPQEPAPPTPEPQQTAQNTPVLDLDKHSLNRISQWYRTTAERGKRPPHPPWMTEEAYAELFKTHGLHKFVLHVSAEPALLEIRRDRWLRLILSVIALLASAGLAFALYNLKRSANLAVHLVRSEEVNAHLREMNIAAAGLAHETRNPLNVVRGLAQCISKQPETTPKVKEQAVVIVEEVDRVNARLNEFITYSKPHDPKLGAVDLPALIKAVAGTLGVDCEEKHIAIKTDGPGLTVMADEGMLRQVVFNILFNAVQAVGDGGQIAIEFRADGELAELLIQDNGPGVPAEAREDIFRPYFSLSDSGTGMGLAVVRQIALSHSWHVEYHDRPGGGAVFRIGNLQVAKSHEN